jgi:hypothetical protein
MGKIFSGFAGMNDFWAHHPLLRILCEQPAIWTVPLTHLDAGAQVPGRKVRFIKVETLNDKPQGLLLQHITAFGPK